MDIYLCLKSSALDNITDVIVCLFGHLFIQYLNPVSGSSIAELVNHVNGAFGKDIRYRYNFVHHSHLVDEETKIQRVKILLEPKIQPCFILPI